MTGLLVLLVDGWAGVPQDLAAAAAAVPVPRQAPEEFWVSSQVHEEPRAATV